MKKIKQNKFCSILLIIGFFLSTIPTSSFSALQENPNEQIKRISLEYSFSFPRIEINENSSDTSKIQIDNLPTSNDFQKPRIPVKPITVLLPYGTKAASISIHTSKKISLGTGHKLEQGGAVIPLSINQSNLNISNNEKSLSQFLDQNTSSKELYSVVGTYILRGYNILNINLYPIQYRKKTGRIDFYPKMDLVINLENSVPAGGLRNSNKDGDIVKKYVENPALIHTYDVPIHKKNSMKDNYEYVIITNEQLKNANGEYTFQDLVAYKEAKGLNATIVTVEEIYSNPDFSVNGKWGDNNPDNPFYQKPIRGDEQLFDDKQARIRNFIRYAYTDWGTNYVLLGGDADTNNPQDNIIPLRGLFADEKGLPLKSNIAYEIDDLPSDVYYACLDGNFNYDEDHHFGDSPKFNIKDDTVDEADLYAEVFVGRACVDSADEVSNFVNKTISYDNLDNDDYFSKVLFLGERLGSQFFFEWGGEYKDLIEPLIPSEYNLTKLYHRDDSWDYGYYWYLLNENPPLIINHDGHGSPTSAMGLTCRTIEQLTNTKFYFIYSHTCLAGSFDNCWPPNTYYDSDCVAEYFTVETSHGAIAVVMNSRYGLGSQYSEESPSGAYDESFFKAVFNESIRQLGPANHYSKEDNIWHINENGMRWVYYETNLFGDPEIALKEPTPQVNVSVTITNPIKEGCFYINDGSAIPISFLNKPVIIGGITLKADVETNPDNMIENVEFIIDNETVYIDNEIPFEYYWNDASTGLHDLKVVAYASYNFSNKDNQLVYYLW